MFHPPQPRMGSRRSPTSHLRSSWARMLILASLMLIAPAILMIIAIPQADAAPPLDVTEISVKPAIFSPDGDSSADEVEIFVSAGADQNLAVNIYDDGGKPVLEGLWVDQITAGLYWGTWNGSRANGGTVPDGVYEIRCSTTGTQGEEEPLFNATVRVHTAPLIMTLFTAKGEPIPEDDQVITGDVRVELATDISSGEPAYDRATLDRFMDNRWLTIGNDSYPDDGWGIPWSITGVPDGAHILRGTLLGPNGSRLGNMSTVLIERPRPPVLPRIELSDIVLWTDVADAKYPPLWLKVEVINKETRPVDLTLTFSTDRYQLETVFLTVNGSDSQIIDSYWGRDADVTSVSVHAYQYGVELASTTEPVDIEDGSEKDEKEALLTEDDLPLALVGTAATVMVASSASFGLGLRRCIRLRVRPPSPRRKRKEEKKQEKQARKQKKLTDKEGKQARKHEDLANKGGKQEGRGGIREQPPPQNVMFNPAKLDVKKTVPWNEQTKEGKGDHSVPDLQFTEGGPSLMKQQTVQPQPHRFVCQNCGRIAGPGFHTCGYCGGRITRAPAPGSFQDSGSGMTADQAMTPNRRPGDHLGPDDDGDDNKDDDDADKDDDGGSGEDQQQPEKQ